MRLGQAGDRFKGGAFYDGDVVPNKRSTVLNMFCSAPFHGFVPHLFASSLGPRRRPKQQCDKRFAIDSAIRRKRSRRRPHDRVAAAGAWWGLGRHSCTPSVLLGFGHRTAFLKIWHRRRGARWGH